MDYNLNFDLFEDYSAFKKFYEAYKSLKEDIDFRDGSYDCMFAECSDCPLSRTYNGLDPIAKSTYTECRGHRDAVREYIKYSHYLEDLGSQAEALITELSVDNTGRIVYENGGVKEIALDGKPKTMFQLVDPVFVEGFADILTMGAIKYSPDNWKKVDRSEYERATYHHWNEYLKGNKIDDESGKSHLYHLACNIMFLDWSDRKMEKIDGIV